MCISDTFGNDAQRQFRQPLRTNYISKNLQQGIYHRLHFALSSPLVGLPAALLHQHAIKFWK